MDKVDSSMETENPSFPQCKDIKHVGSETDRDSDTEKDKQRQRGSGEICNCVR